MATLKIPSQASVRRALTTLKRAGYITMIDLKSDDVLAFLKMEFDKTLLSPKKTSRKKPKHKIIKPNEILGESSEKIPAEFWPDHNMG